MEFNRSQKEMAEILGVSTKAIESYEQGWRRVPPHVEQMLILRWILHRWKDLRKIPPCYKLSKCPADVRSRCPAGHIRPGGFCWLIAGTLCQGRRRGSWSEKREQCLKCNVLKAFLEPKPAA
jgi:hypothetical protein